MRGLIEKELFPVKRTLQSLTGAFGFFKIDPLLRITSPGTITNSWSDPRSDSTTTDGCESKDTTLVNESAETSEVSPSSSEGLPMYVTGGGDSEEIMVTSTSDEFCSWSWLLLGTAVLSKEFGSSQSGRSGWTIAIGCAEFFVSAAAKKTKTMTLVTYNSKCVFYLAAEWVLKLHHAPETNKLCWCDLNQYQCVNSP